MRNAKTRMMTRKQTKLQAIPASSFIFMPEHPLRFYWELLLILIALYLGISQPYILAFDSIDPEPDSFNYTVTSIYILDLLINLNTACYVKGHVVTDRKLIIKEYLKFWFWIDLVSALPINIILDYSTQHISYIKTLRLIKIVRIFKMVKLLKLSKLRYTIAKIEDRVTDKRVLTFLSIFKLQVYIFLVAHIIGCSMYSISADNYDPDSFVSMVMNKCEASPSASEIYITTIYWSYTTMISIGYGDISPVTTSERIFGIFCMSISSGIFGLVLGYISTIINKSSETESFRRDVLKSAKYYLKENNVEKHLMDKVKMYLQYTFQEDKEEEVDLFDLLNVLSEPLCEQIFLYLNGAELENCNVFFRFPEPFCRKISRLMHSMMYAPFDDVLKENLQPVGIFFIQNGDVEIFDWNSKACIQVLGAGRYFGEIGLFTRKPICASVRCTSYTDMILLTCEDFDDVLENFPEAQELLKEIQKDCENSLKTLDVHCYLCKELGHVAKSCNYIDKIRVESREEWFGSKSNSKMVSLKIKRYLRKRRVSIKKIRNLSGIKGKRMEKLLGNHKALDKSLSMYKVPIKEEIRVFSAFKPDSRNTALSNILDSDEDVTCNLDITEFNIN